MQGASTWSDMISPNRDPSSAPSINISIGYAFSYDVRFFICVAFVLDRIHPYPLSFENDCIQARISSTRQALTRSDIRTGAGKVPSLTFLHKVAGENGIRVGMICDWRRKPVFGKSGDVFCCFITCPHVCLLNMRAHWMQLKKVTKGLNEIKYFH